MFSANGRKVAMPEDEDLIYDADDLAVASIVRFGSDFILTLVDHHNLDNWTENRDSVLPHFPMDSWEFTFGVGGVDENVLQGIENKLAAWMNARSMLHLVACDDTPFTLINEDDNTWITLPR